MNKKIKVLLIFLLALLAVSMLTAYLMQKRKLTATSQTGATASSSAEDASSSGEQAGDSKLLEKYGKYAFETFQRYPDIVDRIKGLDSGFVPSQMDPSYPSRIYRTGDGKNHLLLGGCTEHNCSGTKIIVAYNITDNEVSIGKENGARDQLFFLGDPNDEEKEIMTRFYLQK